MACQQGQRNFSGGMAGSPVYRGTVGPIQRYAFTSAPSPNTTTAFHQHGGHRTTSSSVVPTVRHMGYAQDPRIRHTTHASMGNVSRNNPMDVSQHGSRDDSSDAQSRSFQPVPHLQSAYSMGAPMQMTFAQAAATKPAPVRYRRPAAQQPRQHSNGSQNRPNSYYESEESFRQGNTVADTAAAKTSKDENSKSLRLAPGDHHMHIRSGSSESAPSSRSSHSRPSSANPTPTRSPSLSVSILDDEPNKQDYAKITNIPPRTSSSDAAERTLNPSPLSKLANMEGDPAAQDTPSSSGDAPQQRPTSSASDNLNSPAAQQVAAINPKCAKSKSKTSRLRRAFSFGSTADFMKAAEKPAAKTDDKTDNKAEPSQLHKEPTAAELYDAEQEAIARKQEASGLGNSIYGGSFFSGSTGNLSISSTASSASIMVRKLGHGMKKRTRSLLGLFRPKSVIGVPQDYRPLAPEASPAAVSMITVEAERVNVNPDPRAQNGGDAGFRHLERNSLDAPNTLSMVSGCAGSSGTDNSGSRKSIVGGDRERAEALITARKGILKHTARGPSPAQDKGAGFTLPTTPHVSNSPNSSAPSTTNDETPQGHNRTGSMAIGSEDYFVTAMKLRQGTQSAPSTPQGTVKRNATFSPRIVFHDTWPSQEYDRRGDIATCNRLTPMLAQQIKEEVNTFKIEMEVHENSKINTHFY